VGGMNESIEILAGGWARVELATEGGSRFVRAQIVGGWAVHKIADAYPQRWAVSHLATGCRIADFPAYRLAAMFAGWLKRWAPAGTFVETLDPVAITAILRAKPEWSAEIHKRAEALNGLAGRKMIGGPVANPENWKAFQERRET